MTAINTLAKVLTAPSGPVDLLFGTVLTYTAATSTAAAVLTCDFEGAGNSTQCIALGSYTPTVGDNVAAIGQGPDVLVLGTIN